MFGVAKSFRIVSTGARGNRFQLPGKLEVILLFCGGMRVAYIAAGAVKRHELTDSEDIRMTTTVAQKRQSSSRIPPDGRRIYMAETSALAMRAVSRKALEPRVALKPIAIADGSGYRAQLIHIAVGTPTDFRPESSADILCLDLHEFETCGVLAWVRAVVGHGGDVSPCIVVLGCLSKLKPRDRAFITHELQSAGAIFHAWPADCDSFGKAFIDFGKELSRTYGPPVISHPAGHSGILARFR